MNKDFNETITWLQGGIDIENRTLFLSEDINNHVAGSYSRAIVAMARISKEPITIYINTPGGSLYDGMALYDLIRNSGCHIITIAVGHVMSMGFLLFLSGDTRLSSDNTTFMCHKGMTTPSENVNEDQLSIDITELKRVQKVLNQVVADRTGYKTAAFWAAEVKKGDRYYNKEKAFELKIITQK